MRMSVTARQLSRYRPLPVHTGYRIPQDRIRTDSSFAEAIIAKYTASEGLGLPSVSFVYPDNAAGAHDDLDRLASSLITLNRIRVQMNVHNHQWLQHYAISLSSHCELLLRRLEVLNQSTFGTAVPAASLRELARVYTELQDRYERLAETQGQTQGQRSVDPSAGPGINEAGPDAMRAELSEREDAGLVLRILTAASRGNAARGQYMSELHRRLYKASNQNIHLRSENSTGTEADGNITETGDRAGRSKIAGALDSDKTGSDQNRADLKGSDTAGLHYGPAYVHDTGAATAAILEHASQELFRIGTVDSQSRSLTGWASEEARQFFWRIQRAPEPERELFLRAAGYPSIVALEKSLMGMNSTAFRRFASKLTEKLESGTEMQTAGPQGEAAAEQLVAQMSDSEWFAFSGRLEDEGYLLRDGGFVAVSRSDLPEWTSGQARELFWRIRRAPAEERSTFLQAGGFDSADALERTLRGMDDRTFRRFSALMRERVRSLRETGSVPPAISGERLSAAGNDLKTGNSAYASASAGTTGVQARASTDAGKSGVKVGAFAGAGAGAGQAGTIRSSQTQGDLTNTSAGGGMVGVQAGAFAGGGAVVGQAGTIRSSQTQGNTAYASTTADTSGGLTSVTADADTAGGLPGVSSNSDREDRLIGALAGIDAESGSAEEAQGALPSAEMTRVSDGADMTALLADALAYDGIAGDAQEMPEYPPAAELVFSVSENTVEEEKLAFLASLRGEGETAGRLQQLFMENAARTELLRENEEISETLSEAILNMTPDEWRRFSEELRDIPEPQGALMTMLSALHSESPADAAVSRSTGTNLLQGAENANIEYTGADLTLRNASAQDGAQDRPATGTAAKSAASGVAAEQERIQQGIRMSREKRDVILMLREMSQIPDSSLRDLGRVLYDRTVLKEAVSAYGNGSVFDSGAVRGAAGKPAGGTAGSPAGHYAGAYAGGSAGSFAAIGSAGTAGAGTDVFADGFAAGSAEGVSEAAENLQIAEQNDYLSDLLWTLQPGYGTAEQVFLRMGGIAERSAGALRQDGQSGREAALSSLESLREGRVQLQPAGNPAMLRPEAYLLTNRAMRTGGVPSDFAPAGSAGSADLSYYTRETAASNTSASGAAGASAAAGNAGTLNTASAAGAPNRFAAAGSDDLSNYAREAGAAYTTAAAGETGTANAFTGINEANSPELAYAMRAAGAQNTTSDAAGDAGAQNTSVAAGEAGIPNTFAGTDAPASPDLSYAGGSASTANASDAAGESAAASRPADFGLFRPASLEFRSREAVYRRNKGWVPERAPVTGASDRGSVTEFFVSNMSVNVSSERVPVTAGNVPVSMSLPAADIVVPRAQAAARAAQEAEQAAAAAAESTRTVYNDIEFETTTHHIEKHVVNETVSNLQNVITRLDAQQRQIEELRSEQKAITERNIPREVMRRLDESMKMQRLRGGR